MKIIKIYDLTFKRAARFAPEKYEIFNPDGERIATLSLQGGILSLVMEPATAGVFRSNWEIPDLNMFHSNERREKWLTKAAEEIMEVLKIYGETRM
jgi:hypothetical protein